MTAVQVLATLRARGARVEVRSGRLRIEAPKGVLDLGLRAALDAGKAELLDLLTADPHALVAATFARIAGWWVEGAELPAHGLEDAVDQAALAGDLDALTVALGTYEEAARTSCCAVASPVVGTSHREARPGTVELPLDPPHQDFETFWRRCGRKGDPPPKYPQPCAECGRGTWRIVLNEDPLRDERVMEPVCNDCWLDRQRSCSGDGASATSTAGENE